MEIPAIVFISVVTAALRGTQIPRLAAQGAHEPCLVLGGGFPRAQPMTQQIAWCPRTGGHPTMTGLPQGHFPPPRGRSAGWGHTWLVQGAQESSTSLLPHTNRGELQETGTAVPKSDESP